MARHRNVRNLDYDDYADDDDEYDQGAGSYGTSPGSSAFLYQRPQEGSMALQGRKPTEAELAAQHHREQLAAGARGRQGAHAAPQATPDSVAFFKVKPAKGKKGKGGGGSSGGGAAFGAGSVSARDALPSDSMDELDSQMDEETAAAIAASVEEARAREAFMAEAGLSVDGVTLARVSASPPPAAASAVAASSSAARPVIRSQTDQEATRAALEQLRLDKQRQQQNAAASSSKTVQRSPSLNALSASPSPTATPIKIDRPNLPVPTRIAAPVAIPSAAAASSASGLLGVPPSSSNPSSPLSSISGSPAPSPSPSPSVASKEPQELPDTVPAPQSAKRTREVAQALADSGTGAIAKDKLNMVCIGHVDAGKSTLMGHLLFLQGRVSKQLLHKFERESKELGKSTFHFAWVLDETDEERARGVTTDVAVNYFDTPTKHITLLDAPGHREFIPQMITGAAQADAAILVVPAKKGEFEGGFCEDGQIREHAVLARSLGVSQLILAVNKLDTCEWSEERYNEIVGLMVPYLKSIGYKEKDLWLCPISALTGENIIARKEPLLNAWYKGPVLLDLIDSFSLPPRYSERPFRLCIQDVFRTQSLGTAVAGKIESGTLLLRDKLLLLPLGETLSVRSMEARGEGLLVARAGENVEIGVKDYSDAQVLQVGQWLCDPHHPIPLVTHFRAQVISMNYKVPLLAGTQLLLFTQASAEPVVLRSLMAIVDKGSGATLKRNPRVLPRQSTAIVEITSRNKICMELFRNYRELGRFTLRRGTETVAVGVTIKLYRS